MDLEADALPTEPPRHPVRKRHDRLESRRLLVCAWHAYDNDLFLSCLFFLSQVAVDEVGMDPAQDNLCARLELATSREVSTIAGHDNAVIKLLATYLLPEVYGSFVCGHKLGRHRRTAMLPVSGKTRSSPGV